MLMDLTVGITGSLIANYLDKGIQTMFRGVTKNKEVSEVDNDKDNEKERIKLLTQLMSARNTLQYFAEYRKAFMDGNYTDGAEESLFRSLLMDKQQRVNDVSEDPDEYDGLEITSSYCLSIFELYESVETALYATEVFWDENIFNTKEIINHFDMVRSLKVNFDLGEELEEDTLFEISYDLLNIHKVLDNLLYALE